MPHLMANLDFEWGDVPVRGNIGVRYIRSDVMTVGLRAGERSGNKIMKNQEKVAPRAFLLRRRLSLATSPCARASAT